MIRFKIKGKVFDVAVTTIAGLVSVGTMIYAVGHFGLKESWPELVLNMFYLACLVMMGLFFFNRLQPEQFNYWCSVGIGVTILLRDILFAPPLAFYALHLVCFILSVVLLCMLTYFYSRKDWKSYTKRNLWMICVIDIVIAALYNYDIYIEPINEYTPYLLTEIWIRPTITYGLVACFVSETAERIVQNTNTTELIRTSKSWDGVDLPDYLQGRPEVVAIKYEIPAGQKLDWHHHPVMNHGILVQGDLTIVSIDGKEKTVHEGEVVVEMVDTIHHGENRGTKPVVLYMFYLSQEGLLLSVKHPEIPIK